MKRQVVLMLITVFLMLLSMPVFPQLSFGKPEKLNDKWKFIRKDIPDAQLRTCNDERWQEVDIPHDWSIREPLSPVLASATGYLPGGIGWYRKTIYVPEEKRDEKVYLYFEGVYNRSEVFVNGQPAGSRPSGYASFALDASPFIDYGKDNLIAIRVNHSQSADSRWYTGSGIYRNVWLVYANLTHIAPYGVFTYPKIVTKKSAVVSVEVEIENGSKMDNTLVVNYELFSPEGKPVAKSTGKLSISAGKNGQTAVDLKVNNPQLWDVEHPNLYQLKTTVLQGNKVIDETTTLTGIRSFTFDPDKGLALNGVEMKMKGVCLHHDAGALGAAVPKEVWRSRLLMLKELGCNAIRCSHNPHAPDLYDLCDELGLLVMDEAFDEWESPKRKWLEGWNVGTPGFESTVDFFEEWGEKDVADMVRRDRNHVSIFAWSIGNEIDYPNDPYSHPILDGSGKDGFTQPIFGGYKKDAPNAMRLGIIAEKLAAVVKQYDASRPVTAALAGVVMSNETAYPDALDVAGYNYTESLYPSDHEKYPNRIIYGSENGHSFDAWKAVADNPYISGQFLWTGIDYLGEAGRWPSRGSSAGLLDLKGAIKPRGYFRQSLWSDKAMAYIGTYPVRQQMQGERTFLSMDAQPVWNYEDGQTVRVVCYTNAAKAKLELNGKPVGTIQEYNALTGIIYWDIPYQHGKLEVLGLDANDREVARYAIQSSKQPHALSLQSAGKMIDKNKGVMQLNIQVTDEDGVPVLLSDNEITCQITGPVRLLGLESGNLTDMTDYADNKHRVYLGRLSAYIQATGDDGEIKVQFSSPWLKPTEITIEIR